MNRAPQGDFCSLHRGALAVLTLDWQPLSAFQGVTTFTVLEDIVSFGLAERNIEQILRGEVVVGSRHSYRLAPESADDVLQLPLF